MKNPRPLTLWVVALSALLAATLTLLALRDREPTYQGKTFRVWVRGIYNSPNLADTNALFAIRQIGTNGLPWLLLELDCRDNGLKRRLYRVLNRWGMRPASFISDVDRQNWASVGFRVLGRQAAPAVPALVERLQRPDSPWLAANILIQMIGDEPRYDPYRPLPLPSGEPDPLPAIRQQVVLAALQAMTNPVPDVRMVGASMLTYCPFAAELCVPALLRGLKDGEEGVRRQSAVGLGQMTQQPVASIPPLIEALSDPRPSVRQMAATSLGRYHRQAKTAVPYLLKARSDPSPSVRLSANKSLEMIDPETAASIPDLPGFKLAPPASPQPSP